MVTNDNIIQVKDLKKYYKKGVIKALDGVSVDIARGDVVVVWIDAEKALDLRVKMQRKHIANMNVDFKRLIIVVPETAEETWGIIEEALP